MYENLPSTLLRSGALVDRALQQLEELQEVDKERALREFCEAVIAFSRPANADQDIVDPTSQIFDRELRLDRSRVAACLLRLIGIEESYFHKTEFAHKAFRLWDDECASYLYQRINLNSSAQTYEKREKLRDVAPAAERVLREQVSSLVGIKSMNKFYGDFRQKTATASVRAVIVPFLSKTILEGHLKQVCQAVDSYSQANDASVVLMRENIHAACQRLIKEAHDNVCQYQREFFIDPVEKLQNLVDRSFESNPLCQPAHLRVELVDKKYPLHQENVEFPVDVLITNEGPGVAYDVRIKLVREDQSYEDSEEGVSFVGTLDPLTRHVATVYFNLNAQEVGGAATVPLLALPRWRSSDNTEILIEEKCELRAQRTGIDWNQLLWEDPYCLDPVSSASELVGRNEILDRLKAQAFSRTVGSSYIYGQKRVGKTSIVRALEDRLLGDPEKRVHVIYLLLSDIKTGTTAKTVDLIVQQLATQITGCDPRLAHVPPPPQDGEMASFTLYLNVIQKIVPESRFLFILDEFDSLPAEFYRNSPVGSAFFSALRAISFRPPFGFVLVGSENMHFALSWHGAELNRFAAFPVDYFDRETHWADFQDLVRKPVANWLEYNDDALLALYHETAGNPYFTKHICREVFNLAVSRRDGYITPKEVEIAVRKTISSIGPTGFQHFWIDGLLDSGGAAEDKSLLRRRVLLAVASALRTHGLAEKGGILEQGALSNVPPEIVEAELTDFVNRKVLVQSEGFHCKVPLFEKWLREHGWEDIITRVLDEQAAMERARADEEARVKPKEIVDLVSTWPLYKSKPVTENDVRFWLDQFKTRREERLMFRILQDLTFYNRATVRAKMNEAFDLIVRDMAKRGVTWTGKRGKRDDILVSYLDQSPAKSGTRYATLFVEENKIVQSNAVSRPRILDTLAQRENIQALIFVDDIIGTGGSVTDNVRKLLDEQRELLEFKNLHVYIVAVCGFLGSQERTEQELRNLGLEASVRICDPLGDENKCFSTVSKLYSAKEREEAMYVAKKYGSALVSQNPLGYGDCQAAIVFEDNCPNNTLPILWAKGSNWKPLFPRL